MAFGEVTIEKSVYNRIPFIVENTPNSSLITEFGSEVMAELYVQLNIKEEDKFDETKYSLQKKSLIADLTAIQFIKKRILSNMEGEGANGSSTTKALTKAKAGEVETEWEVTKASDGNKLQASAKDIINQLMSDAMRKARTLGFLLDISQESQWVVEAYSQPGPTLQVIDFNS
jgi:hypothetical protein